MTDKDKTGADGAPEVAGAPRPEPGAPGPARVTWDDSNMRSGYANVVNVLSTREEVSLLFGTNETWNAMNAEELVVRLSDRIVLTPYAAKRLLLLLERRVKDYEDRFGKLDF